MPAFDTSVLIPLFDVGHPRHGQSQRLFLEADMVLLHPCVLQEVTTVVRRNAKDAGQDGNKAARAVLRKLLAQPRVRIAGDMDYDAVVELYVDNAKLSFTDAVVCGMRSYFDRKDPVTFDERMVAALGKRGRRPRSGNPKPR